MKGITILALMTAGFVLFAGIALGVTYAKYDEATTTVTIDNGITCTINGKEVSNGETITVTPDLGSLRIHVESDYALPIGISGGWQSGDDIVTAECNDATDYTVNLGHGKFVGELMIGFIYDSSDLGAVILTFTITDDITVKAGGTTINNGDTYTFNGDGQIIVTTNDGEKHNVKYNGSWSNPDGMSGGASGQELNSSVTIYITDMMFFSDGHGTMDIHI